MNENDIMSIIAKALTNDAYITTLKTNKENINLTNISVPNRKHQYQMELTFNKTEYKCAPYTDEEISALLESEITSTSNEPFTYTITGNNTQLSFDLHHIKSNTYTKPLIQSIIAVDSAISSIKHKFASFIRSILVSNNISYNYKPFPLHTIFT